MQRAGIAISFPWQTCSPAPASTSRASSPSWLAGRPFRFLAFRYSRRLRKRAHWAETWKKQRAEDAIDAEVAARRDEFLLTEATYLYPRQDGETPEAWSARLANMTTTPSRFRLAPIA